MSNKYLLCAFLLTVGHEQPAQQENLLQPGRYIGMEYMGEPDITPDDKNDRWYYENKLFIKGNLLLLKSVPVVFYKREQYYRYSASDGGFFSYLGKVYRQKNQLIARMKLTECDYCASPNTAEDSISYLAVKPQPGGIIMNKVFYRKY